MAKLHVRNRFGVTPNEVLCHRELTWKAKGLYWYIQSKPENWEFAVSRICKDSADWEKATISGIKELENAWYLERKKTQNELWHWEIEYILYESPVAYNRQEEENPPAENPPAENPVAENRQINKEIPIKKELEKNISFADFWKIYPKKENKILAEKRWNKLKDKEHEAIIEALQKTWNPYWTKKYQTPDGKLPTDYIKAPDGWLLNRKWEETPGTAASPAQIAHETNKAQQQAREKRAAAEKEEFDKQQSIHKRTVELAGRWFHTLPDEEQKEILEQVDKNNTVKLARNAIDRVHPGDEDREQKIAIQKNIIKKITEGIILERYKTSIF